MPANEEKMPNTAVRKSVALNAVVRPMRSEPAETCCQADHSGLSGVYSHVPQPTAPNIMPANIDEDSVPT